MSDCSTDDQKSKLKIQKYLLQARSTVNHFIFDRKFVTVLDLSRNEALFLQDVINLASLDVTRWDEKGFFLCTVSYLKSSMKWSEATQTRMLNSLESKNFIRTERRGKDNLRWVFVDLILIEETIRSSGCPQSEGALIMRAGQQSERGRMNVIDKKERKEGAAAATRPSPPLSPEQPNTKKRTPPLKGPTVHQEGLAKEDKQDREIARSLTDFLRNRGLKVGNRFDLWVSSVQRLRESIKDKGSRFRDVMSYYVQTKGSGVPLPDIDDVKCLTVKNFLWIEDRFMAQRVKTEEAERKAKLEKLFW